MKNVALHNLGCKVNSYETEVMQQKLVEKGYHIVPFDTRADIYIVNTCTVTNIADRKSRQMLHRAKQLNPEAVVVAVGCYVQTGQESLQKDESVDLCIGNNRKRDIAEILEEFFKQRRNGSEGKPSCGPAGDKTLGNTTIPDIGHTFEYEEAQLKGTAEHTRVYIKIQDGCNQFCSYCAIPYARGRVRSRRLTDILTEVQALTEAGYREIVLTGIHISSYGIDFENKAYDGNSRLTELVEAIHEVPGIRRIRLSSLEPRVVTKEAASRLAALPKVCPHFHLSLQSGSDTVLRRMNRRYDTAAYYGAVELLRKYYADPAVTTDVIVGFPGETEAEFGETEAFLRRVGFYEMHIFKYSRRKGTRAADMEGQLSEAEKALRSDRLMRLEKELSRAYRESFLGKREQVLFEEAVLIGEKTLWVGHTPHYIKVAKEAAAGEDLHNRLLSCRLESFIGEEILRGET